MYCWALTKQIEALFYCHKVRGVFLLGPPEVAQKIVHDQPKRIGPFILQLLGNDQFVDSLFLKAVLDIFYSRIPKQPERASGLLYAAVKQHTNCGIINNCNNEDGEKRK